MALNEHELLRRIEILQGQLIAMRGVVNNLAWMVNKPGVKTFIEKYSLMKSGLGDLLGTTNQVTVTGGTDCLYSTTDVTLSLPQNIHTAAEPKFASLELEKATTPTLTLHCTTHSDTETGRDSYITFWGEQSGGEETVLAQIIASHDGTADDEKGEIQFRTNDGNDGSTLTTRAKIDSSGNFGLGVTAFGTNAAGAIGVQSGTAPTSAPADMSQVWVQDRNGVAGTASLHYRNEDTGAAAYIAELYGEMYSYENATLTAIDETNVYHAIHTIATGGTCKGWTFKAGSTGPIASFATYGGGLATLITDVGHGLVNGEIITISNSTNYNGSHVVTRIDNDTFTIPVAYVAEAGGPNWIRGSSLRANSGSAGVYKLSWNTTCFPAGANDNFKVEPNLNTTDLDNMAASCRLTVAADRRLLAGGGIVTISDGDYIWMTTRNEDAPDDITFRHFNVSIVRI